MSDLRLSLACWDYDRTRALREGTVRPAGIDLTYLTLPPEQTFFRMLRFGEFDAAEMSLSSYVLTLNQSPSPYVAIPVFPSRAFRHGGIYVPADGRVREPADLAGAVVGVPEYQMTAAVWIRGILAEHHGVPADRVSYRTGGLHEAGRHEKVPLDLPARFDVRPIGDGQTLDGLLRSSAIDALYSARAPRSFDPARPDGPVRRLFPDVVAAEEEYARQTGIFPIMHTLVLRRAVYERHPWVARSLLDAFTDSKRLAYPELLEVTALKTMLPWGVPAAERTMALLGTDFWPYGVAANRVTLDAFLRYSHDQGLAAKPWRPEDLFVPETLESTLV
jgi:4,5-dihydroxyphthalate decarboxylase